MADAYGDTNAAIWWERTIGWLHSFRRVMVRHEYYGFLFDGFVHLAAALRGPGRTHKNRLDGLPGSFLHHADIGLQPEAYEPGRKCTAIEKTMLCSAAVTLALPVDNCGSGTPRR